MNSSTQLNIIVPDSFLILCIKFVPDDVPLLHLVCSYLPPHLVAVTYNRVKGTISKSAGFRTKDPYQITNLNSDPEQESQYN